MKQKLLALISQVKALYVQAYSMLPYAACVVVAYILHPEIKFAVHLAWKLMKLL